MTRHSFNGLSAGVLLAFIGGCTPSAGVGPALTTRPAATQASSKTADQEGDAQETWSQVSRILQRSGQQAGNVYTVTVPRDDLSVSIEGMEVPTGAGIASVFHFYRCSCGKTAVVGEFVLADYEANDVAYALQKENILISSMGPYLLYEKPRLMSVRFQAEGDARQLARVIKAALDWTGKNRAGARSASVSAAN
ncbi:MAG TPA: DUF1259 domain-containing protein [Tepidisphaeraceae bacterium]|nr:DUF1259 domain-containing protein [Tepidisphaeraceae bacterium]